MRGPTTKEKAPPPPGLIHRLWISFSRMDNALPVNAVSCFEAFKTSDAKLSSNVSFYPVF